MENDFQLRAYSPFFDFKAPIHTVVASFAKHAPAGTRLVIKAHPLDPGMRNWARIVRRSAAKHGVSGRVDFVDGGNLAVMLEASKGCITVNSTVGLWSMRVAVPTITLGTAVYDIEGLTFQGRLDQFWTEARPPRPELWHAFVRAIVAHIQIRGVYYAKEALPPPCRPPRPASISPRGRGWKCATGPPAGTPRPSRRCRRGSDCKTFEGPPRWSLPRRGARGAFYRRRNRCREASDQTCFMAASTVGSRFVRAGSPSDRRWMMTSGGQGRPVRGST